MSGSPPRSRTRLDELSPDEALHLLQTQNRALRQRLTTANQAAEQHAALQAMQRDMQRQLGASQQEAQRLQSALGTALRQRDEQRHLGNLALHAALADADAARAALSAELSALERLADEMRERWAAAVTEAATAAEARAALRAELEAAAVAEHERLHNLQVR